MTITQFLKSLGSTSEEIAASLLSMGITGEKKNAKFCPIIKAIYHKFPNMSNGLIATFFYTPSGYRNFGPYGYIYMESSTCFKITWNDCQTIDPSVPKGIGQFVKDFDSGKYPFLEGKTQSELRKEILDKLSVEEKMALGI